MLPAARIAFLIAAFAGPALAAEEPGCERFAWSVARERASFAAEDKIAIAAGATIEAMRTTAFVVHLVSGAEAGFVIPPQREPKAKTWFGGTLHFPAPDKPGPYQITISDEAWIDVVQDGRHVKALAHSGRRDCPGIRKSVRFEVGQTPFLIQLSGADQDSITLAVSPVN